MLGIQRIGKLPVRAVLQGPMQSQSSVKAASVATDDATSSSAHQADQSMQDQT